MTASVLALVLMSVATVTGQSGNCPAKYLRFSQRHTYCAQTGCNILSSGVTDDQKREIVDVHNFYRNKLAKGEERNAGGMPTAAKMLEMVWDQELADIAQKLTETCNYGHDCGPCKMTPSFSVGQNIGLYPGRPLNWTQFLTNLYDEVPRFHKSKISPFVPGPHGQSVQYGHFTQMAWDTTWTVGCGMSQFMYRGFRTIYYACNYGPAGNIPGGTMYETGDTASKCPANTCSGSTCSQKGVTANYDGLCKVVNEDQPPEGSDPEPGSVFYCNFLGQDDCKFTTTGTDTWTTFHSKEDNYASITLSAGQSTSITFKNPFKVSRGRLCIDMDLRMQPAVAGQYLSIDARNSLTSQRGSSWSGSYPLFGDPDAWVGFIHMNGFATPVRQNQDYTFSLTFTVPPSASQQIVEIKKIVGRSC